MLSIRESTLDAKPAKPRAKPLDDPAKSFFAKHCIACHGGIKPKGDFDLNTLTFDFSNKINREQWTGVLEQLKIGTMPPKDKPRPSAIELKTLSPRGSASKVTMRRLNRAEYGNTVRDLLGV